jgi:hypothetical protein
MGDVKRYDADGGLDIFGVWRDRKQSPNGDYVLYTDYTALRARLEAVEKERAAITKNTLRIYEAWEATKAELSRAAEALATARRDALEEAAKYMYQHWDDDDAQMHRDAIRAMKEPKP